MSRASTTAPADAVNAKATADAGKDRRIDRLFEEVDDAGSLAFSVSNTSQPPAPVDDANAASPPATNSFSIVDSPVRPAMCDIGDVDAESNAFAPASAAFPNTIASVFAQPLLDALATASAGPEAQIALEEAVCRTHKFCAFACPHDEHVQQIAQEAQQHVQRHGGKYGNLYSLLPQFTRISSSTSDMGSVFSFALLGWHLLLSLVNATGTDDADPDLYQKCSLAYRTLNPKAIGEFWYSMDNYRH